MPKVEYQGETGIVTWKTTEFNGLRLRIVEYSAGYKAGHWCQKGHIVHCIEGEVINELEGKEFSLLQQGMTDIVSDDLSLNQ